jgi:glutamate dehydrogenase/leucine dehydrogenase
MTVRGLKQTAEQRLHDLTGLDPSAIEAFLKQNDERRQELAQLVRAEEAENEEFYRELGDR